VTDSSLPVAAQALVKIRASQINGRAPCTDAHAKDAAQKAAWNSPSKAPASPTRQIVPDQV
jgi:AhpD family alkylhydroperoxidase